MGLVGAAFGIGQLLASQETITVRLAVGRALISGVLGIAAGTALTFFPNLPIPALAGIAAALAAIGVAGVEKLFQRFIGHKK